MHFQQMRTGRCFDILLDYGEDINTPLRELAKREGISTAVVTAGLGGFNRFALGYAQGDSDRWEEHVLQLASVQGMLLNGEPQIHAVVTLDGLEGITRAGRCEDGCKRLFYGQFLVQELLPV